ncbi:hypothetical protein [Promicromonospora soli]|uniref:Uncharacterized protein n=1 Tax=Promicromonospora soli TaxID=2035533 RepID=A0A919L1S9_9MICO|nr:hypothetical protein [Promicromonospora soli]GHH79661.1 hypothetical protein GCM10017772_45870 [Promicromonospora soli]
MTSVEAVDPAEGTETESPRRRRGSRIAVTVIVALLVGIGVWQGVARVGRIETGSSGMSSGLGRPPCMPRCDFYAAFDETEDVVVAHEVSNPSLWPVTVISTDPEAYRFEPLDDDPAQDISFVDSHIGCVPQGTQSAVVVPPGRSVAMWVVNPQGGTKMGPDGWRLFDGARLRVRSLGVERDVFVPHPGTLYVDGSRGSEEFTNALEGVCKD